MIMVSLRYLDELDTDEASDLYQIISLTRYAEEKCDWVTNIAKN